MFQHQPLITVSTALAAIAVLTGGSAAFAAAPGSTYPVRPIRLIVPFAPGGGTDITARLVAQPLSEALGQPVIPDNRAGAGGIIGTDMVAKATPDGYTLVYGSPGPLSIGPNLQKVPYDPLRDLQPITQTTRSPLVLVVHPGVPAGSVKEFIALARAKPNGLNYGSAGNGSVEHLGAELFKAITGVQLVHVPYKGTGPSMADLMAGRIEVLFENLPPVLPHIRTGKLKALAVGTLTPSAHLPDLPTLNASGAPGYEASSWFGFLAPAKTPRAIIDRLNTAIVVILRSAFIKERFYALGAEPVGNTPEEYHAHIRDKLLEVRKLVALAGMKVE